TALGDLEPWCVADARHTHFLVFAPVWCVSQEAIVTYFVTPAYFDTRGTQCYGHDPAYRAAGKLSAKTWLPLDLKALEVACEAAETALETDRKCLIGFSVHSTTLRDRDARAAYLAKLAATPDGVRKYISARIAEVEHGVPMVTL